ncbi:transcriptional regulator [Actinomyces urogenitalis]|uniref:transcriptional regulator n=1 Tax=Actinomyces urogenitalis TaxID=103621 RepID=UPI00242D1B6A|nr:transcriptional regulator [Actinomyces urogenitalis]MCI7456510.1 transcriptional regulator [Actinomyces urogenitalis]
MTESGRYGRRHRRVVALSQADQARVARGELPEAAAEEERRRHVDALTDALSRADGAGDHANDARLLRDVPPHWG